MSGDFMTCSLKRDGEAKDLNEACTIRYNTIIYYYCTIQ